ncbi:lipopolysaccharide biosynthesis protein [Deinococcus knuensis]|nr:oligosaccharide flippase family protein [Deinococcus knuensis]
MKKIVSSPTLKRISTLMGGTVMGQLAVIATTPLVTRLYSPEAFSDLGIYMAIAGIFSVIATLRLEAAVPAASNKVQAVSIVHAGLISCVAFSITASLLSFLFFEANVFRISSSHILTSILIGLSVLFIGGFQILSSLQIYHEDFGSIAKAKLIQGVALAILPVLLGLFAPNSINLASSDAAARVFGALKSFKLYRTELKNHTTERVSEVMVKFKDFAFYSTPASIVNAVSQYIPVLIFNSQFDIKTAGLFVFANRVLAVPIGVIARTLSQVFLGEAGAVLNSGKKVKPVIKKYFIYSSLLAIVPAVLLFFYSDKLISVFFGSEWIASIPMIKSLLILSIVQISSSVISQTLNIVQKNSWQLFWDIFRMIIVSFSIIISLHMGGNIFYSVEAYAFSNAICYIIMLIMVFRAAQIRDRGI